MNSTLTAIHLFYGSYLQTRYNNYIVMQKNYSLKNIVHLFSTIFPIQYLTHIANCLGGIINGYFVGNYLTNLDMVALGFYNPYQIILSIFFIIVSTGTRIVCGKFKGRGQKDKINETFTLSMSLLMIIGILLTIGSLFFAPVIAKIIGASPDAFDKTVEYIKAIGVGMIPFITMSTLMVFLQMENESKYSLMAVLIMAFSNLVLDYVFAKFFTLSIFTVGLFNSISQIISFIFILIRFINDKNMPVLVKSHDYKIIFEILMLGLPAAVYSAVIGIRNVEFNKAALICGGNEAVGAMGIMNSFIPPFDAVAVGMATSVATLASVYYGEKDRDSLRQLYKTSLIFCELFTVVRLLILIPFAKQLSILFGATGEVINYTIDVSILYALAMPINIPCIGFMNIHQTLGKVTNCNIIYVVSVLFVNLFCARVLSGQLGVTGIWIGYILQESSNLLLIYIIAAIRKKKLILSLDDVLFYDDDINVGTHITISINNIEDAINLSKQIEDYCISENVDSRRAKLAGLCIEEMTVNIIEIGFPKSKSINKNIDIYCDVDDESKDVNIRIKDNTVAFDPYVKVNEADKSDNIGVRIVSRIAKEMSYQVNFGLNVLSITL